MSTIAIARLQKEVIMLQTEPPPGAWAAPCNDNLTEFNAQIQGPLGTVYEGGIFRLSINIPARYPMEPPKVRFSTPVYHPNIDPEGRICLDILNPPPKGSWRPSLNLSTVLSSVGLLLADPNPDDGLVTDTTNEFKHQRIVFDSKAREWTRIYAMQNGAITSPDPDVDAVRTEIGNKQTQIKQLKEVQRQNTEYKDGNDDDLTINENCTAINGKRTIPCTHEGASSDTENVPSQNSDEIQARHEGNKFRKKRCR